MLPNKTGDFRTWGVDTSREHLHRQSARRLVAGQGPVHAGGWTGNLSWFASAAVTVTVYNT